MNKMTIGIPKEVKDHEYRVGATPDMVRALTQEGHNLIIETLAGDRIGYTDAMYAFAGAKIASSAQEVYSSSDMIIKVKEPQPSEYPLLQEGQILFCYLHLAPDPQQTQALIDRKVVAIAYETVTDAQGRLPLLVPMSEMAGRIAVQAGAASLQMINGGRGVLLGGVPGVAPGRVVVIGGGVVGTNAARLALGLGADVTIVDHNLNRLRDLDSLYGPRLKTCFSTPLTLEYEVTHADLLIAAVLVPGKMAPRLISKKLVEKMLPGSVIVDVAIDQGGCIETSRPTTHSEPTYIASGVVHYCVTNMPGACARSATQALTNATMPYAMRIANLGYKRALQEDAGLKDGLNVCLGHVTHQAVAQDLGYEYESPQRFLS